MKSQDMYLGVLFSMEDLSVYGYMTNTKVKFITVLTVPDVIIKDLDMKNVFRRIHAAYVNHTSNPFYDIDSQKMIKSKKFEQEIEAIGRGRALEGGHRSKGSQWYSADYTEATVIDMLKVLKYDLGGPKPKMWLR
ncbi:hypothetical protein BG004_006542 [Podila humilis]|nr:hypothetical protein BG004_006542 [Podila humilis]